MWSIKSMGLKCGSCVLFFIVLLPLSVVAEDQTAFSKEETVLISNGIGLAAITTWGVFNWDYFQNDPKKANEGWFAEDTKNGGQDKFGHLYFSYALSHALSAIYKRKGVELKQSAFLGSVSALGLTTFMEMGDSFSDYGFAYEDVVMNLIGSAAGYLFYTRPDLSEKIDFRIEYRPNTDKADFTTDYEHQKYLIALKLDGFDFARTGYLKYLELQFGYFARGYDDPARQRERNVYAGIGINISRVFKALSMHRTAKVFNYVQVPYTYINMDTDLNH